MTIEELSARLEKVERANRRMRAVGAVVLVIAAAGVAMGQATSPPKVIRAESFEVVDKHGKKRATLDSGRGQPHFRLLDSAERGRISFSMLEDGSPSFGLNDEQGEPRIFLALMTGGRPVVSLQHGDKRTRVSLQLAGDGSPGLTLSDQDGGARAVLGEAIVKDPKTGKSEATAPSSLVLFDKDGKVLERLPR